MRWSPASTCSASAWAFRTCWPPCARCARAGVEFVETEAAHTERRGAITKTYLGSVVFELVHSDNAAEQAIV